MLEFLKFWDKQEQDDQKEAQRSPIKSFAAPDNIDGATEVEQSMLGPMMAGMTNVNGEDSRPKIRELVRTYRGLANYHEVDDAIQEIVDEAIVVEDGKEVVWLDMDSTDFSENIKKRIDEEFGKIVQMLKLRKHGHKWFRRWYVDSRIYFHKILDKDNNIIELRPLDPTKLELVREIKKEEREGVQVVVGTVEYYLYKSGNGSGYVWTQNHQSEVRIPKEAIVFAHSGQYDSCGDSPFIIGYLHRAIKPANQLKMLEDALVIYRLSRAPERRVFYVDVGNLPTNKAQQYVNGIINSVKNRLVYDTNTGKVKNQTSAMSMLEDYYLPRREGGKGTEVTTLPSGQNLGEIEDVQYFNRKLFKAMYIPSSRAASEDMQQGISFGGGGEITRDELKFSKFIRRLQSRFEQIMLDPLKHQLIVNNIITEQEWDENVERLYVTFNKDSYFEEAKDLEILNSRMNALREIQEHVGVYFSNAYVQKEILRLSDDQIETIAKEIEEEQSNPQFKRDDGF
ncbi:portal protein [Vibrio phage D479]